MVSARRSVAAFAPGCLVELVNLDHLPQLDSLDQELGDPIAAPDVDRFGGVQVDEVDLDLPAVPGVDRARRIDDRQSCARGQSGPWMNQANVADGNRCCDPRPHEGSMSRRQLALVRGVQVNTGIGGVRPDGQGKAAVQTAYPQHPAGSVRVVRIAHGASALLPGPARLLDTLEVVTEEDLRPPPDRAPRPVHSESLRVPAWWWVLLAAVTIVVVAQALMIGARWWMWLLVVVVPALLAWLFISVGRARIEVESDGQGGGTLYAGRARLPFDAIARSAVVPATAKQAAMGRQLDPEAFVVHRGYIPTMVIVVLDDPMDPTPYWLISTRDPEGLAAALPDNHYS